MKRIVIYVKDKIYGERLLGYLAGRKSVVLQFLLVTQEENLLQMVEEEQVDGLVVEEGLSCEKYQGESFVLFENLEFPREEGVFKYQKGDIIFKEVESFFAKKVVEGKEVLWRKAKVVCVFSPEGNPDITEFAIKTAQERSLLGATLYISLSPIPVIFGETLLDQPPMVQEGLSELLCMNAEEDRYERIQEQLFPFQDFQVLSPLRHYKDLLDMEYEDYERLLNFIKESCYFDTIVVELSQLFEHSLPVLAMSDQILFLSGQDMMSRIRYHVFCQYVLMEQQEELISRWEVVRD